MTERDFEPAWVGQDQNPVGEFRCQLKDLQRGLLSLTPVLNVGILTPNIMVGRKRKGRPSFISSSHIRFSLLEAMNNRFAVTTW